MGHKKSKPVPQDPIPTRKHRTNSTPPRKHRTKQVVNQFSTPTVIYPQNLSVPPIVPTIVYQQEPVVQALPIPTSMGTPFPDLSYNQPQFVPVIPQLLPETEFNVTPLQDQTEVAMTMFKEFARKYNISNNFASKLRKLGNFKIVMLNDDSGSMNSDAYSDGFLTDPYAPISSRFNELRGMVQIVMDGACILSKDLIDVYFLNRSGQRNVRSFQEIEQLFVKKPEKHDLTPIVKMLKEIIATEEQNMAEKKVLIFLAFDGQPTDSTGHVNISEMDAYLDEIMAMYSNLYITMMACVSDEALLKNMDRWGRKHVRIGVVDEYFVEKKEQEDKHDGDQNFEFTHGDYITKALLVSVDLEIKALFRDDSSSSSDGSGGSDES